MQVNRLRRAGYILRRVVQSRPFTKLAHVYDDIVADVDYQEWCDFILEQAAQRGVHEGPVLELGCGTGNLTLLLHRRSVEVTGLDFSPSMLAVARAKEPAIDWQQADITSFTLGRRYSLVLSVFDTLNNLLDPAQFLSAALRARSHLLYGGLFMFDVNTTAGLRELWQDGRVEGWSGETYYRWTHGWDADSGLARIDAYCRRGESSFTEVHHVRPYDPAEVKRLLTNAGFTQVEVLGFPDGGPVEAEADRIWVCARP